MYVKLWGENKLLHMCVCECRHVYISMYELLAFSPLGSFYTRAIESLFLWRETDWPTKLQKGSKFSTFNPASLNFRTTILVWVEGCFFDILAVFFPRSVCFYDDLRASASWLRLQGSFFHVSFWSSPFFFIAAWIILPRWVEQMHFGHSAIGVHTRLN